MNRGASEHLERVHGLPCATCGAYAVEAHHINEDRTFGKREKLHFCTIPLCAECHRGPKGVHGDKTFLRISKKSELELLGETLAKIYG